MGDTILTAGELVEKLKDYEHIEIHIHHTWKPEKKDFNGSNHQRLQDSMRNYHINTLGWSDIGQHVSLMPDGNFITGRDFDRNPASIRGKNSGAFAVEMIGNFDKGHDTLEGKQLEAILEVCAYFHENDKYIRFHRENSGKTCPGSSIDKNDFIEKVINYQKTNKKGSNLDWKTKDLYELHQAGIVNDFEDWVEKIDEPAPNWLVFILMNRIRKQK